MKKLRNHHILARARDFISTWHHLAPAAKFGGTPVDELEQKTGEAEKIREEIQSAETRLSGLRLKRDQTERALADELIRLAFGVRGHPDFGSNSLLPRPWFCAEQRKPQRPPPQAEAMTCRKAPALPTHPH